MLVAKIERSRLTTRTRLLTLLCSVGVLLGAAVASANYDTSEGAPANAPPPRYYGVNLASGSFGGKRLPGVYGKDYVYPTRAIAEPFREIGMNTVRLPFKWERLQPVPLGPLNQDELARLDKSIDELSGFSTVILDVHNYARFGGVPLDKPSQPAELLPNLWTQVAQHYKGNPRVAFGMMNEPHGIDAAAWRRISDQSLAAIRRTGAKNLILIPGTRWTGGHSWSSGGRNSNAAAMSNIADPARNFVYEIHQYLDSDSSGTKKDCVDADVGERRLAEVTRWMRQQKARAILAEFGVVPTPVCLAALDNLLGFLRKNGDVWVGWTYWAGGDWWGNYPFSIQPKDGTPRPQSAVLQRHIASYRRPSRAR